MSAAAGTIVHGALRLADHDPGARPARSSSREADQARLEALALEIDRLQTLMWAQGQAPGPQAARAPRLLLVLQGMDTSGKDGTARAVFGRCSPLGVRVAAFKAPTEEERARDFLWRVHAQVPRAGELVIFNRSHYEDVLVPVVTGGIDAAERERRLVQIKAFERLLVESGTTLLKCFLHLSKAEQARRLQARLDDPEKRWKFQASDLATRAQWDAYQAAYETALAATSTAQAPWHLIPADSKSNRNLMVAERVAAALRALKLQAPPTDPALAGLRIDGD